MDVRTGTSYKYYFWKRFFLLFIPLFLIGILPEPFITENPFNSLEDYGEFAFVFLLYLIVMSGISAFFVSMRWRMKHHRR
ncbi:hypothetical protein [Exiguobacterium sp. 17-1]|uniref:hypothetical protein n=1 Tax=Exiguobacterium sp. 17-1 TaxID=2931981 RepID=UPI001FFF0477|nr:hypothetical protein [Exiguobacterium sp. 17-1]MCK2157255.1 hypothetical protein [Exiguobacterium sp. 17-1]